MIYHTESTHPCLQFDLCNCVGSYLVQTVLPTLLCAVQHKMWLVPRLPTRLCTIARLQILYDEVLYDEDVKLSLPVYTTPSTLHKCKQTAYYRVRYKTVSNLFPVVASSSSTLLRNKLTQISTDVIGIKNWYSLSLGSFLRIRYCMENTYIVYTVNWKLE